jgi:hypothetical protein
VTRFLELDLKNLEKTLRTSRGAVLAFCNGKKSDTAALRKIRVTITATKNGETKQVAEQGNARDRRHENCKFTNLAVAGDWQRWGPTRDIAMIQRLRDLITGAASHWEQIDKATQDRFLQCAAKLRNSNLAWCVLFAEATLAAQYCANRLFGPQRKRMGSRSLTSQDVLGLSESDLNEFYDAIVMAFICRFVEEHEEFREPFSASWDMFMGMNIVMPSKFIESAGPSVVQNIRRAMRAVPVLPTDDPILEYCLLAYLLESYHNRTNRIRHRINEASLANCTGTSIGPVTLYKYRDWNDHYHRRLITHREIYLSEPKSFVDELDCRVPIRFDVSIEDARDMHLAILAGWIPQQMEVATGSEEAAMINDHTGVLSLTQVNDSAVMWDQYGSGHSGFCIGFVPGKLFELFDFGRQVMYSESMPIISHEEPIMSKIQKQLFTKVKRWRHEREYRLIRFGDGLTPESRRVSLPLNAFSCLILGRKMSPSVRTNVLAAADKTLPDIPIYETTVLHDNGRVELREI